MTRPSKELRIANVVAYVLFIAVNVAASRGWLGPTNARLSDRNRVPLTPAGWAFSIWGVIFLLQGLAVAYQAVDYGNDNPQKAALVHAIGYWWIAGWAGECAWQLLFQLQSKLGMWLCLAALVAALVSFTKALINVYGARTGDCASDPLLFALYELPTSMNTAWLSVATCLGALIALNSIPVAHLKLVSVLLAGGVTLAGLTAVLQHHDLVYGAVLVWAFAAVRAKQGDHLVGRAALVCLAVVVAGIVLALSNRRYRFWASSPVGYSEL